MSRKAVILLVLLSLTASLGLSACSGQAQSQHTFPMAEMADMPVDVQQAPPVVQEAYRFAAANPDVLTQIPCYCGCGGMGHTSNYACYVAGENADGSPAFDGHALGCSLCVDITQDTMRMLDEGKPIAEIRAYVDQTYSRFGPSNMP
ncbi:MAG: hypothetical protein Fur0018_14580 [Anaerolineales bacterium]